MNTIREWRDSAFTIVLCAFVGFNLWQAYQDDGWHGLLIGLVITILGGTFVFLLVLLLLEIWQRKMEKNRGR